MESVLPAFIGEAGTPFNRPDADVIVRSIDGINFRTFKAHILFQSEVFNLPFSEEEFADGLPIVPFYDPSPVLKGLLCYCDPTIYLRSSSVPLIDIQNLAMKYDMMPAVRAVYRDRIRLERELPPSHMLGVITQRVGQDMYLAAANIFTYESEVPKEMVDLGLVTQTQFDSLLRYRDDCRAKAVAVAMPPHSHFTWMSPTYNWFCPDVKHDSNCNKGGNIFIANVHGKSMMRYWWRLYIEEARNQLKKRPWGSTVTSGDFFDKALKEGSQCSGCRKNLVHDFGQFANLFAKEIDNTVSQVQVVLT